MSKFTLFSLLLLVFFFGLNYRTTDDLPKMRLSEYGFFEQPLAQLKPVASVFPYEVNAPLFTDYAEKLRLIYLPENTRMGYDSLRSFAFPDGAVIIKNFYYFHNATAPEKGRRILETRLLIKETSGWKALTYIWNDDQSDAVLEVAGASIPVEWVDYDNKKRKFDYGVPNNNQCKGCHSFDGKFTPIGPSARQLNRTVNGENQLQLWEKQGKIALPAHFDPTHVPALNDYRVSSGQVNEAARAYLDANCGHCHNAHGPASTSGMFLDIYETNPERLGIGKPPVAAGRGSGNLKYGIVPGKPDQSILYHRMESADPGVRMPEVGRQLAHKEGLALIKAWIERMK